MLLVDEWWILTIQVGDPQVLLEAERHIEAKTVAPLAGEEGHREGRRELLPQKTWTYIAMPSIVSRVF